MIMCKCLTKNNNYIEEYAYSELLESHCIDVEKLKRNPYINIFGTLDIETTTLKIDEKKVSFLYHIQLCIHGKVYFFRTIEKLKLAFKVLQKMYELTNNRKLVIYIQNLGYEHYYLLNYFKFSNQFYIEKYKPLRFDLDDVIECRCSYRLFNKSLEKILMHSKQIFAKSQDLDYDVIRTPETRLDAFENGYCYVDVKGLYLSIEELISGSGYDVGDVPLTSTGFVRKEARRRMSKNKKNRYNFVAWQLNTEEYQQCRETGRGGNVAVNRLFVGDIEENVESYDMNSAYIYGMLTEKFPTNFFSITIHDLDQLYKYNSKYCTMGIYHFKNLKVKKGVTIPYIAKNKLKAITGNTVFNGRILEAYQCSAFLTNIDFDIIKETYDFEELRVTDFKYSKGVKLPPDYRKLVKELYLDKYISEKKFGKNSYEYIKSKEKLLSLFGMIVTNILREEIILDSNLNWKEYDIDISEKLESYYESYVSFLTYQWGMFVSAYCRKELQIMIDEVGKDVIYVDTDCIKCRGDHSKKFSDRNLEIIKKCEEEGGYITDPDTGELIFTGIWEKETTYDKFITLGAKKYAYEINGQIGLTVSGLDKNKGAKELERLGGIDFFKNEMIFEDSGRNKINHVEVKEPYVIKVLDEEITISSHIIIESDKYTLNDIQEVYNKF